MTRPSPLRGRMIAAAIGATAALAAGAAMAAEVVVPMALATPQGPGASVGKITLKDAGHGVEIALDLHGLPPGAHGFHMHEKPSCAPAAAADGTVTPAGAAGAHYDPAKSGTHLGPQGAGHLGDLPLIEVGADGAARQTLSAHRLHSVADFKGRALMIHAGGDTYSDTPALGGGGARLACGVVE